MFVDSTGMSALIAGHKAAEEAGVIYEVREIAPFIERQLHAAGVFDHLVPRQSEETP